MSFRLRGVVPSDITGTILKNIISGGDFASLFKSLSERESLELISRKIVNGRKVDNIKVRNQLSLEIVW